MNRPIRINIESDDLSDSSDDSCSSNYSTSSYSTLTVSPTKIPVANRIRNVITDVIPYDYNDNLSLPTTYSDDNSTDEFIYKKACLSISFVNFFLFFVFILVNNQYIDSTSPNIEALFFRAISEYPKCKDLRYEIWRLFTYSFVHGNFLHLLGNTLGLFITLFSFFRFQPLNKILFVYFISVINGALSFFLTDPYSILIGSSGGVYGLFGSHIANFVYNHDSMMTSEILFIRIYNFCFIAIDLINYLFFYSKTVAYQVHWYSFLFGLASSLVLLKEKRPTLFKKNIRILGLIIFCYTNALLLFNYIFNYPPKTHFNFFKLNNIHSCCFEMLHHKGNLSNFDCFEIKDTELL